MNILLYTIPFLIVITGSINPLPAQDVATKRSRHFNLENDVALQGFDPVAYLKSNKAIEGSKDNAYTYQQVTYYFNTSENLQAFKKEPEKYEPMYGGWCAYAMGANGEKVSVDPKTFKVQDGKLYLFYNKFFVNTLPKWNSDEANLMKKANISWSKPFN